LQRADCIAPHFTALHRVVLCCIALYCVATCCAALQLLSRQLAEANAERMRLGGGALGLVHRDADNRRCEYSLVPHPEGRIEHRTGSLEAPVMRVWTCGPGKGQRGGLTRAGRYRCGPNYRAVRSDPQCAVRAVSTLRMVQNGSAGK
jgi:hypothetical protein